MNSVEFHDKEPDAEDKTNFKAVSLPYDERGFISSEDKLNFFEVLRAQSENRVCFDCAARNASWISVTLSIYLCLTCSGQHRNLGSKISFVRSTELDDIRLEEALKMEIGGNARAKRYFRSHGITDLIDYRSKTAEKYKRALEKEVVEILTRLLPGLQLRINSGGAVKKLSGDAQLGTLQDIEATTTQQSTGLMKSRSVESSNEPSVSSVMVKEPQFISQDHGVLPFSQKVPPNGTPQQVPTATFFGSSVKAQQRAKVTGFDFDFDNAFAASQEAETASTNKSPCIGSRKSHVYSATNPSEVHGGLSSGRVGGDGLGSGSFQSSGRVVPKRDLTNAKSISAADFRDNGTSSDRDQNAGSSKATIARFKNAQAISSDAYFNNDPAARGNASSRWSDGEVTTRLAVEGAIHKATQMVGAAQESFRNAANWFSRVSASPPYP